MARIYRCTKIKLHNSTAGVLLESLEVARIVPFKNTSGKCLWKYSQNHELSCKHLVCFRDSYNDVIRDILIREYLKQLLTSFPVVPTDVYLFKVIKGNPRTMCEICSELTINTPELRHWCCSGIFIVHFEQILLIALVFPFLTLNKYIPTGINYFVLICHLPIVSSNVK